MAAGEERAFFPQPLLEAKSGVVVAPFQFTTTNDDHLRIVAANSLAGVTIAIQCRRLTPEGNVEAFTRVHTPNSNRTVTTQVFPLGKGALLNAVVFAAAGAPLVGQTFVSLQIVRGLTSVGLLLGTLLQGYITSTQGLGWPGSPIQSSTDGEPVPRFITGTQPVGGSYISEVVPTGARWELMTVLATLQAGAGGANREITLQIDNAGVTHVLLAALGNVPPLGGRACMFAQGLQLATLPAQNREHIPLPQGLRLLGGSNIYITNTNAVPPDQWTAPFYSVREWLEVP